MKDGAVCTSIVLPENVELKLRYAAPAATTNKAQKRHSGKKIASSEQVCRQKEVNGARKNTTQSAHAIDKSITLVLIFHSELS